MNDPNATIEPIRKHTEPDQGQTIPGKRFCVEGNHHNNTIDLILGRYKVLSKLGIGAMGVVYKCFDNETQKEVAIKVLKPEISHDQDVIADVIRNFQLVENLNHPHIANIKQLTKDPPTGNYYLIMEYVSGITLTEYMNNNTVSREQKKTILQQIASALDFIHSRKLIHRDIKPDNIMISINGEAKILDLGIATPLIDTKYEQTDTSFCGTAHYIAPELWMKDESSKISSAVDLYSFAVIVFEWFYGVKPFNGNSLDELKTNVLFRNPAFPIQANLHDKKVLQKALARNPEARYTTCEQFITSIFTASFKISKQTAITAFIILLLSSTLLYFICKDKNEEQNLNPIPIPPVPAGQEETDIKKQEAAPAEQQQEDIPQNDNETAPSKAKPKPVLPKPVLPKSSDTAPKRLEPVKKTPQKQIIKMKKSPRLLIRCGEKIRNLKCDTTLSQGLLQEMALNYGFRTINPEYVKNKNQYDFVIDVRFSGVYELQTFSFNKKLKLNKFTLGADINATTPNGDLIAQVTLPSQTYSIGKISDPQEALRDAMRRRIVAKDNASFHNVLLQILGQWYNEIEEGMTITLTLLNSENLISDIEANALEIIKKKNLVQDYTIRGQDENGTVTIDITSRLQAFDLAKIVVVLTRNQLKIKSSEYNKITLERK